MSETSSRLTDAKHAMPTRSDSVDYVYYGIIAVLVLVATWLLLMPWVPAIASATMHRFHLRTRSFPAWAVQQPIPSMYNFANRYEVREVSPGMLNPVFATSETLFGTSEKRYLNHFPTRVLTFANTRYRYLSDGGDRWLIIDSSYRGQRVESTYHARPRDQGGYEMVFVASEERP